MPVFTSSDYILCALAMYYCVCLILLCDWIEYRHAKQRKAKRQALKRLVLDATARFPPRASDRRAS